MKKTALTLLLCLPLIAFAVKVNGIYSVLGVEWDFRPDGTVRMMGAEMEYKIVGDEIKVKTPQSGTQILKIVDDNTLTSELFGVLKKKK